MIKDITNRIARQKFPSFVNAGFEDRTTKKLGLNSELSFSKSEGPLRQYTENHMKRSYAFVIVCLIFTACGSGGPGGIIPGLSSDKFVVKLKGAEVPFEMKKSVATIRGDLKQMQLLFANFDIDLAGKTIMGAPRTSAPGQERIAIYITNKKATPAEYKTPVMPGEYSEDIYVNFDNRDDDFAGAAFLKPGAYKVIITSVTADTVTGSVDLSVGDNVIKGKFEAKIIPG